MRPAARSRVWAAGVRARRQRLDASAEVVAQPAAAGAAAAGLDLAWAAGRIPSHPVSGGPLGVWRVRRYS
jgi:hypothetical protein